MGRFLNNLFYNFLNDYLGGGCGYGSYPSLNRSLDISLGQATATGYPNQQKCWQNQDQR